MPIPGGVGVTEAGMTAGLAAVGVPSDVAVSAVLTYRLISYYLRLVGIRLPALGDAARTTSEEKEPANSNAAGHRRGNGLWDVCTNGSEASRGAVRAGPRCRTKGPAYSGSNKGVLRDVLIAHTRVPRDRTEMSSRMAMDTFIAVGGRLLERAGADRVRLG